jgi:hypothetical protein
LRVIAEGSCVSRLNMRVHRPTAIWVVVALKLEQPSDEEDTRQQPLKNEGRQPKQG